MPARMTTDRMPERLRKRETEVLAMQLFRAQQHPRSARAAVIAAWNRLTKRERQQYRHMARAAFTHVRRTYA